MNLLGVSPIFLCMAWLVLTLLGGSSTTTLAQSSDSKSKSTTELIEVRKIWDQAPHNAFTDLVHFKGNWLCVFREGQGHVSPDGALRVISSSDGSTWKSNALIVSANSDLRDAKLTIMPNGSLMLCGAGALHDKSNKSHQSLAWFSSDGVSWSDAVEIGEPNYWLWRVNWHGNLALGVGYGCGPAARDARLYSSNDGKQFTLLNDKFYDEGYPNETSIVFAGDTAYCLMRRDGKPNTGLLGTSQPPYRDWKWKDLKVRLGGPQMIRWSDGRLLAAVRLYDNNVRTSLCWIDPEQGTLEEFLKLPSGGDTSYAGLVAHEDLLWVSYYSSHEGKTSIYLAKVKVGS